MTYAEFERAEFIERLAARGIVLAPITADEVLDVYDLSDQTLADAYAATVTSD